MTTPRREICSEAIALLVGHETLWEAIVRLAGERDEAREAARELWTEDCSTQEVIARYPWLAGPETHAAWGAQGMAANGTNE